MRGRRKRDKTAIHASLQFHRGFLRWENKRENRSYWKQDAGISNSETAEHERTGVKYEHAQDKRFYVKPGDEYRIGVILGDRSYCKIKTEELHQGKPGETVVEGTTFGWVIQRGVMNSQTDSKM